ncbi:MAG TPA: hypothetical protein DEB46_02355 [Myxococcales bacterium]|jgi:excisionase family DNA binding protein|nr:hypothetical protein [Myxococcales bacterium]HBU47130.1 hypothetical protein [Myxococcales bacterium]|tara:strand:- start:291 stop:833 length:543 start_codon:yes stop_codon:yes gene_type:complete
MSDKSMLTVKEFSESARVSTRTVRRWISAGKIRFIKQGKQYLIPMSETAAEQIGAQSPPRPAPRAFAQMGEGVLRDLLFWVCDQWVDQADAMDRFLREDPKGAEAYFRRLVAEVDRSASAYVDPELALRLRFVARDLLRFAIEQIATDPPPHEGAHPTLPLVTTGTGHFETLPLSSEEKT